MELHNKKCGSIFIFHYYNLLSHVLTFVLKTLRNNLFKTLYPTIP